MVAITKQVDSCNFGNQLYQQVCTIHWCEFLLKKGFCYGWFCHFLLRCQLPPHTYCAVQMSRIWTPSILSAHSSHPCFWNQTWVTAVEHLWTLCGAVVALQSSILGGNWETAVSWKEVNLPETRCKTSFLNFKTIIMILSHSELKEEQYDTTNKMSFSVLCFYYLWCYALL